MSSLPWIAHWGWQRRGKQSPWETIKSFHQQDWLPLAFWEKRNFLTFSHWNYWCVEGCVMCNQPWLNLVKLSAGQWRLADSLVPIGNPVTVLEWTIQWLIFVGESSHSISPPLCHLARFRRWGKLVTFFSHGTEQLWRPLAFWLAFLPTANANLKAVGS